MYNSGMETHPYFDHTRAGKHALVTRPIAERVVRGRRSWVRLDEATGRTEYLGYSPEIGLWVRVIVLADGRLFNAFWEMQEDAHRAVREIEAGRG